MNVTLRQLHAFLRLAASRNFSNAAQEVGLSQPAFSLSIRRLEETIGARLFDRDTRTVALTPEKQEFLPVAQRLVEDWTAAFSDIRELIAKRRGRVVVAALPSLAAAVLPSTLARYATAYPGVELGVRDVIADEILNLLKAGKADLGLSVDPGEADDLVFEPLLSDRFVLICRNDHPLARRERATWADLARHPFIAMARSTSVRQHIERALDRAGVHVSQVIEVDHLATVSGMLAAGLGLTSLPSLCLPVVLQESMAWRPVDEPEMHRRLGLLRRRRQSLSVAAAALAAELRRVAGTPSLFGPARHEVINLSGDASGT
jgi:LysR family carnitine catabolism transcriptional activator